MKRYAVGVSVLALVSSGLVACGTNQTSTEALTLASNKPLVNITLEGPNQWNNSGTSFGSAWTALVKNFEKADPGVRVHLSVLPLSDFGTKEAAQIAAGTAPAIMFDQVAAQAYELTPVTKYLKEPDPYVPGNREWLSLFKKQYYSLNTASITGGTGNYYEVPLNIVALGLYYNQSAFQRAGIKSAPATFQELLTDAAKLKAKGYIPFGMTNTGLGLQWTWNSINGMLMNRYYHEWNWYKGNGSVGKSAELNDEDLSRAILTKKLTAQTPGMVESLKLMKQLSPYFSPGWSGISSSSGAGVDVRQFIQGKAAIIWGTNFGYEDISDLAPHLRFASIPFPTITKSTTALSTNVPARFGASIGGTTYVIPATTKGPQLTAAIRFLQFATAPKNNQQWLQASSGNSVIVGSHARPQLSGFAKGQWAEPPQAVLPYWFTPEYETTFTQIVEGYLLGSKSLQQTESSLETAMVQAAQYQVQQNKNWTGSWTKLS